MNSSLTEQQHSPTYAIKNKEETRGQPSLEKHYVFFSFLVNRGKSDLILLLLRFHSRYFTLDYHESTKQWNPWIPVWVLVFSPDLPVKGTWRYQKNQYELFHPLYFTLSYFLWIIRNDPNSRGPWKPPTFSVSAGLCLFHCKSEKMQPP